jgi:hypothetical protein
LQNLANLNRDPLSSIFITSKTYLHLVASTGALEAGLYVPYTNNTFK